MRKFGLTPFILVLGFLLAGLPTALAVQPGERLADPALEARARAISKELRCLVCQNQSIDDSDAELARDLRQIVRERLLAGDSDAEVLDYVVDRYGEFSLMTPRLSPYTWALWAAPGLILLAGVAGVWVLFRRRQPLERAMSLSPDEQKRLNSLLDRQD